MPADPAQSAPSAETFEDFYEGTEGTPIEDIGVFSHQHVIKAAEAYAALRTAQLERAVVDWVQTSQRLGARADAAESALSEARQALRGIAQGQIRQGEMVALAKSALTSSASGAAGKGEEK